MNDADRFPWREVMAVGFGGLGLSSRDFWAMTPRELAAAVEGAFGMAGEPPDRATLETLMMRYPDRAADPRHHEPSQAHSIPPRTGEGG